MTNSLLCWLQSLTKNAALQREVIQKVIHNFPLQQIACLTGRQRRISGRRRQRAENFELFLVPFAQLARQH